MGSIIMTHPVDEPQSFKATRSHNPDRSLSNEPYYWFVELWSSLKETEINDWLRDNIPSASCVIQYNTEKNRETGQFQTKYGFTVMTEADMILCKLNF